MPDTRREGASAEAAAVGKPAVLIVDDREANLVALEAVLEGVDCETVRAQSGNEALRWLIKREFALMILDVMMPEMDGYEVARHTRSNPATRELPIIFVTAAAPSAESELQGYRTGAVDYIVKPLDPQILRSKVEVFLELYRERQRLDDEARRAEQRALGAAEALAVRERVLEQMPIGVIVFEAEPGEGDAPFRILWHNPAARMAGGSGLDLTDATITEALSEVSRAELLGALLRALETGQAQTLSPIEVHGERGEAAVCWEVRCVPLGGRRVAALFADVTEQRSLERQMHMAQRLEAIGRLAGGVAHDFNNLLTVINANAELLLREIGPEDGRVDCLRMIHDAADRAVKLTSQLLAFSRQQPRKLVVMNVNEIIEGMTDLLRRVIGEDVELRTALAADLGSLEADPAQIEQVLMNLVVNARDAMPVGGELTIATANAWLAESQEAEWGAAIPPGAYVKLTVSDTGRGMTPAVQRHVFEPFFTTKPHGKGTGLGLSTVYGIVTQSGGSIRIDSAPDEGTTFEVYLPRVEAPPSHVGPAPEPAPVGGTETILLVEDEPLVRRTTRKILDAAGYRVIEAEDGRDALRIVRARTGPIDLLLTDVVMPGMGGRELAARLVASHPELRVLYMSGYDTSTVDDHGLQDDPHFIQKPFTRPGLLGRLRAAFEREPSEERPAARPAER